MKKITYLSKFHLVDQSPWLLIVVYSMLSVVLVFLMFLNEEVSLNWFIIFLILLTIFVGYWFRDVVIEGTYLQKYTIATQKGLKIGMFLFLFFGAYFDVILTSIINIGSGWSFFGVLFLNILILLLLIYYETII